MATTKKSPTTKKVSTKRTPVKKGPVKARPLTWRFYAVTVGIFAVAVAAVVVIALFASSVTLKQANQERFDRISSIYGSLDLGDEYSVQTSNIFGDKRVYSWDKGRTYSSVVTYVHGDSVSNTVAALDTKIKAAGFKFIDEPYPGSAQTQYHYKSAKGEYLRLSVSSKPYDDAYFNASVIDATVPESVYAMDKNAGPANVTIKVNLDDNNE